MDNRSITFRPIGDDDREFLYRVYASTREEELAQTPWNDDEKQQFLQMQFTAQHTHYQKYYDDAQFDLILIDGEPIGNKAIDGQAVTGFRVRRASLVDDLNDQSVWEVWADSETAQVVRVDINHERDEGGSVTLVDFNFDVAFDDAAFDFQPPPGYTIAYESIEELDSNDGK